MQDFMDSSAAFIDNQPNKLNDIFFAIELSKMMNDLWELDGQSTVSYDNLEANRTRIKNKSYSHICWKSNIVKESIINCENTREKWEIYFQIGTCINKNPV